MTGGRRWGKIKRQGHKTVKKQSMRQEIGAKKCPYRVKDIYDNKYIGTKFTNATKVAITVHI